MYFLEVQLYNWIVKYKCITKATFSSLSGLCEYLCLQICNCKSTTTVYCLALYQAMQHQDSRQHLVYCNRSGWEVYFSQLLWTDHYISIRYWDIHRHEIFRGCWTCNRSDCKVYYWETDQIYYWDIQATDMRQSLVCKPILLAESENVWYYIL